ncbi:hypothetical protein I317_05130 [Kwoniella heveanensis CBS 569]|uniref:Uncharacterized protein n=1 Tax=Kwoniella heveanensis BCC8398 TaxID=1296120 RepID=A0A1B9GV57_9TREE|nr:hypothetical protein I316_03429 [Kwoniella heveanensis BCC8398]OCF41019.1 hypothetical protein I317_05130 [Kwoniella heveanensis CBS 569]
MRTSTALLAALAATASVSANANINSASEDLDIRGDQEPELVRVLPIDLSAPEPDHAHPAGGKHHMPCHGSKAGKGDSAPGPLGALLSRLGLSSRPAFSMDMDLDHPSAVRSSVIKHWKEHVDSMMSHHHLDTYRSTKNEGSDSDGGAKLLPFLEGGHVRLMPLVALDEEHWGHWMKGTGSRPGLPLGDRTPEIKWWRAIGRGRWLVKDNAGEWREPRIDEMPPRSGRAGHHHDHAHKGAMKLAEGEEGPVHGHEHHAHGHRHGHHGHRYRMAKSVAGRLHRALKNLKPAESIAMAFIIGAGLGSILHFIFMLFLLSVRSFRCGARRSRIALRDDHEGMTWEEARRARKMARKEARKARKAERKAQKHGQAHGELLPAYEEGEGARLVTVAEKEEQEA